MNEQTRLNVNINSRTAMYLQEYANRNGVTITESLRRLVGIGGFILEARDSGKDVLFRDKRSTEKVIFDI